MLDKIKGGSFVSGALWLSLSAIVLKVIGVFYKIPLSYMLGDEGMGYFNSAYTIYIFFYIIGSAGIPKAMSIVTVRYEAETERCDSVFRAVLRFFSFVGILLSLIFFFFSGVISRAIASSKAYYSMLLISPTVLFVCASGVVRGYLNGKTKFSHVAISELISGIFKLFLGVIFALYSSRRGYSVEVISAYAIFGITVGAFFGMIYLLAVVRKIGVRKRCRAPRGIIKEIAFLALPMTAASAMGALTSIIDLAVVMNGLFEVGYAESVSASIYGNFTTLALPIFSLVTTVVTQFSSASLPLMTRSLSENDRVSYSKAFYDMLSAVEFVVIPSFFAMLFFPLEILRVVFEHSSAVLGYPMLAVLSVGILFFGLLSVYNTAHEAKGSVRVPLLSLGIGALSKLIITLVFIKNEAIGILAAPLGTVVSYATALIASAFCFYKVDKERQPLFRSMQTPLLSSLLALPSAMVVKNSLSIAEIRIKSLTVILFYGIIYLLVSLILHINANKKRRICQNIQKEE